MSEVCGQSNGQLSAYAAPKAVPPNEIFVIQEFFIGQWSDMKIEQFGNEYGTNNRLLAESVFKTLRNTHYRKARLIIRNEFVLAEGKTDEDRW